jgi:hypothetical protein
MTDVTLPGGTYPQHYYAGHIATATRATFCTDADLINPAANVLAMPNCPITVLNAGAFSCPEEFFGMHIKNSANNGVTGLTFKTVRSHDLANGKGRWQKIQTTDTQTLSAWDFADPDAWYAANLAAGRDMVWTLFATPTWASARPTEEGIYGPANLGLQAEPADINDWIFYCTTIATRYPGIQYFEVWNEPNMNNDGVGDGIDGTGLTATGKSTKDFFFSGKFAKLAEMVRTANQAIKAVNPTAQIICPPVQGWAATANTSDTYFTGMLDAPTGDGTTKMWEWVDIIGVHFYPPSVNRVQDYPAIIDRLATLKTTAGVSSMELWDTESAPIGDGYEVTDLSDPKAWKLMLRAMVIMAAKGVSRTMYYQYDHADMGFEGRTFLIREREALINTLRTGMYGASMFTDGRVVYSCAGGQYVI